MRSGGDLMERLAAQGRSSYEEREAAEIVRKIAGALSHCHSVSCCRRRRRRQFLSLALQRSLVLCPPSGLVLWLVWIGSGLVLMLFTLFCVQ